jgi:hypothetical protein
MVVGDALSASGCSEAGPARAPSRSKAPQPADVDEAKRKERRRNAL